MTIENLNYNLTAKSPLGIYDNLGTNLTVNNFDENTFFTTLESCKMFMDNSFYLIIGVSIGFCSILYIINILSIKKGYSWKRSLPLYLFMIYGYCMLIVRFLLY